MEGSVCDLLIGLTSAFGVCLIYCLFVMIGLKKKVVRLEETLNYFNNLRNHLVVVSNPHFSSFSSQIQTGIIQPQNDNCDIENQQQQGVAAAA